MANSAAAKIIAIAQKTIFRQLQSRFMPSPLSLASLPGLPSNGARLLSPNPSQFQLLHHKHHSLLDVAPYLALRRKRLPVANRVRNSSLGKRAQPQQAAIARAASRIFALI